MTSSTTNYDFVGITNLFPTRSLSLFKLLVRRSVVNETPYWCAISERESPLTILWDELTFFFDERLPESEAIFTPVGVLVLK